ncbi:MULTISPECIES: hypothetical protein [Pseudomonas]|uniref:hypothetical protein n=1 Tax=Pseudomonas TaxID=286 RepID=UPI001039F6A4|nr:hypothetical protein [Pseudomonas sp. D1HM]MBW0237246.1 hypothetical protein [Pseudomonas sp. D1HM]
MRREIARSLFLLAALAIASVAMAAWEEPRLEVLSSATSGTYCPLPRMAKVTTVAQPDHQLLLFMFGMSQGLRPQG